MRDSPTLATARHVALWQKADPVTRPSKVNEPPNYRAHHRQRVERKVEAEPVETEGQEPKMDAIGAE